MPKNSDTVSRLEKSSSLLDVMIQVEDWMDSLDLYAFKNWLEGEVVEGPHVKRYWILFTLKYEYKEMPDPQGAIRMLYHGTKVAYRKGVERVPVKIEKPSDYEQGTKKPKMKDDPVWLIDIKIPRRFIEDFAGDLDLYDDEVDKDHAKEAEAEGMKETEPFMNDDQDAPDLDSAAAEVGSEEERGPL